MNQKALQFLYNICYAVGANLSRIATTLCLTLLLPKLLSVEDYSYWQLYGFYGIYLSHSSIGWCEGTYLKYGGRDYKSLDGGVMAAQFWGLAIYEALFMFAVYGMAALVITDEAKFEALLLSAVFTWFYILRYQIQIIFQASGRIREYAGLYTGERLLNFILVLLCLAGGWRSFRVICAMEIASNAAILFYGLWRCRDLLFCKFPSPADAFAETRELIGSGYKLTLAALASQLIIGIVRFAIEQCWGTVAFGKLSLSLSMANMVITCIAAVSIVLFPLLRKIGRETMEKAYDPIRDGMTAALFGCLVFYQPVRILLEWWLPQYTDSLRYLALIFPLFIYETRNTTIICTYLKTLRREGDIMRVNVIMVAVSTALTVLTVGILKNLALAAFSIVVLYAVRAIYTEALLLQRLQHAGVQWAHLKEGLLTVLFIAFTWNMPAGNAFFAYLAVYLAYLLTERKALKRAAAVWKEWMTGGRR